MANSLIFTILSYFYESGILGNHFNELIKMVYQVNALSYKIQQAF